MSKLLAGFIDQPEVLVESAIKKLEHLSGWESTDVRLIAEINNKVRAKLSDLGLDPDDTTGPELYHALLAKLSEDEKILGSNTQNLVNDLLKAHEGHKVYALRDSAAKDLLRKHPPKKLMKQLNYRSVDSMLKRESILELYAGFPLVESARWMNVYWKDLSKLSPSDFETRRINVVIMSEKRWGKIHKQGVSSSLSLNGAVALWGESGGGSAIVVNTTISISDLLVKSGLIKLKNVESHFGKNLVEILQDGSNHPLKISHMPISWHAIFRHYGSRDAHEHTEFFGPHLLHEDIKAHNPLEILSRISPVFEWWQDLEYSAKKTGEGLVSLNLVDVLNSKNQPYKDRSLNHFRGSVWREFINRYMKHPSVEQHFMQQLEPQTVPIEDLEPVLNPERDIREMIRAGV